MRKKPGYHIRHLFIALSVTLFIGFAIEQVAWTLVVFLSGYLVWTISQLWRLYSWLYYDNVGTPPESKGLWGDVLDAIHRLQRDHQKARDRQQAMLNRIQESTNALKDAVVMTNSRGAMEWWNNSAEEKLGFKFPIDRGQLIYSLVRTPSFKPYFLSKDYKEPLIIASPVHLDMKLQLHITLFGEDDRLIIAQNITRLVRLEEMRRDFVSNVSHELRTPLTVITGYLETLIDHSDGLPSRWLRPLQQMQVQSRRMEALITDLLLLSKIENEGQGVEQETIDVSRLLKTICDDAKSLNTEKQHAIVLDIASESALQGSKTQLQSAFSNILLNAVKYTPAKGEIHVRWYVDEFGGHFSVRDSGVGIDPIHIPRLTERFYRADPSRAAETGGTGLGLAIVKHVLINHDATLEISSMPGEGSTFTCHFVKKRVLSHSEWLKTGGL